MRSLGRPVDWGKGGGKWEAVSEHSIGCTPFPPLPPSLPPSPHLDEAASIGEHCIGCAPSQWQAGGLDRAPQLHGQSGGSGGQRGGSQRQVGGQSSGRSQGGGPSQHLGLLQAREEQCDATAGIGRRHGGAIHEHALLRAGRVCVCVGGCPLLPLHTSSGHTRAIYAIGPPPPLMPHSPLVPHLQCPCRHRGNGPPRGTEGHSHMAVGSGPA